METSQRKEGRRSESVCQETEELRRDGGSEKKLRETSRQCKHPRCQYTTLPAKAAHAYFSSPG